MSDRSVPSPHSMFREFADKWTFGGMKVIPVFRKTGPHIAGTDAFTRARDIEEVLDALPGLIEQLEAECGRREQAAAHIRHVAQIIEDTLGDDDDAEVWPSSLREVATYLTADSNPATGSVTLASGNEFYGEVSTPTSAPACCSDPDTSGASGQGNEPESGAEDSSPAIDPLNPPTDFQDASSPASPSAPNYTSLNPSASSASSPAKERA